MNKIKQIIRRLLGLCPVCGSPRNEYGGSANRDEPFMCQLK